MPNASNTPRTPAPTVVEQGRTSVAVRPVRPRRVAALASGLSCRCGGLVGRGGRLRVRKRLDAGDTYLPETAERLILSFAALT